MDIQQLGLFVAAVLVLNLTPGPDMLFSAASGMKGGSRAGLISALGIGVGGLVHALLAAVGVTALIASSDLAFTALRIIGAFYLLWIGVRSFKSVTGEQTASLSYDLSGRRLFARGFVTNVLNPKVGLFFIAFLPQFVDPASEGVALQIFLMGCFVGLSGTVINGTVGFFAGEASQKIFDRPALKKAIAWLSGSLLIMLGVRLLFVERK
ncbi:MAG: LysE family translocator [Sneathiella sp.]